MAASFGALLLSFSGLAFGLVLVLSGPVPLGFVLLVVGIVGLALGLATPPRPAPKSRLAAPARSAESRLHELAGLLEKGLITEAEWADRRAAILESV